MSDSSTPSSTGAPGLTSALPMPLPSAMIIDDNEADRYLLRRLLIKGKIAEQVFEATNGIEAIDFLREKEQNTEMHGDAFPPLLVFLDINMPLLNGFGFLKEFETFRDELNYQSIVLMMFSSSESPAEVEQAMAYEFVRGFVHKMPSDADELRTTIRSITASS